MEWFKPDETSQAEYKKMVEKRDTFKTALEILEKFDYTKCLKIFD